MAITNRSALIGYASCEQAEIMDSRSTEKIPETNSWKRLEEVNHAWCERQEGDPSQHVCQVKTGRKQDPISRPYLFIEI